MNIKRLLAGFGGVLVLGVMVAGTTGAFFVSEAESQGNTFTTGSLDLLINPDETSVGYQNSIAGGDTPGYDDLAPGGDTANLSTMMRNEGTVDGTGIGIEATHTNNNLAKQLRITQLDWRGDSLLTGGAGADIPEYEAPATSDCDYTINNDATQSIQTDGINVASAGDTVCVDAGTYVEDLTIGTDITLVALNAPDSGSKATIDGRIDVNVNDVTVKGFEITNPDAGSGIVLNGVTGGVITHNIFTGIGTTLGTGNIQALYLSGSSAEVKHNTFTNIGDLSHTDGSAKAIFVGDSSGAGTLSNIVIENNEISNVKASTIAYDDGGRGTYGILINYGVSNSGITDTPTIKNNTISNLEGLWSHAIGLEGDTPNASVTYNDISNIVDHKSPSDAVAVFFEDNPSAGTVSVNQNNLIAPWGLAVHPSLTYTGTIDAENNWWGTFTPSDVISDNGQDVDHTPFLGGPVIGFINGTDQNGNGFADLHDLALSPITNAEPGLVAGDTGRLDFYVQLDGPTTGNTFQNADLSSDFTYTLSQITQ